MLGATELTGPEGNSLRSVLARPKLLGLLSYLAAATPAGFQRRDAITGLFWGELSQERARSALRQALYNLRQFLGEGVVVTRGDEEVGLDVDRFWSDVAGFEGALERGHREEALDLYRGDLLPGFYVAGAAEFERWVDGRREELRERARVAAWQLAQGAEAQGNAADAARWARQALRLAPLDEDLVRQVIEMMGRLGDRSGAVREYEAFATRLAEELGLEPAAETRALIEAVRSRTDVQLSGAAGEPAEVAEAQSPAQSYRATKLASPAIASGLAGGVGARLLNTPAFRLGMLVGAALVVSLAIVWAFSSGNGGGGLDERRVAVAVFDNQTGRADLGPLGRMAADWVTQGLDQIEVVDVAPSATGLVARPGSGSSVSAPGDVRALAEATGARTVIAGAYYLSGDSIQFQAQVVDAQTGRLLTAVDPVGGPLSGPDAVVETLRQRVVGTIATIFDWRVSAPPAGGRPPSLESYRAYLQGYRAFNRSQLELPEALRFFYRAVALDSSFLDARFHIVFSHASRGEWQAADSNAQLLLPYRSSMSAYQRATLDWQLASLRGDRMGALQAVRVRGGIDVGVEALRANYAREAVDVLAGALDVSGAYYHCLTLLEAHHMLGDYQSELREARRGRAAYPGRLRMLEGEVRALAALGDTAGVRELLDESELLAQDDGWLPGNVMIGAAAELRAHGFRAASFDVAERAIKWYRSRPIDETATRQHWYDLANAYYLKEHWEEARVLFEDMASETPSDINLQGFLGVLAAKRGDIEAARTISDGLTGMAARGDFGRDLYWQACIASLLGEREYAMERLRDAYARGHFFTVNLHRDMDLEPLRDYPAFQKFIAPRG